jgi:hypothetical protein
VDLPPEPEQLTWREAFWRFFAIWFVRARLGDERRLLEAPPALSEAAAETD